METNKSKAEPTLGNLTEVSDGSTQSPNQAAAEQTTQKSITPQEELEKKEAARAQENAKYVGD